MFNFKKFCFNFNIRIATKGKHVTPGWLNIDCPFCGGNDGHLGVHIDSGAIKCWKCGPHGTTSLIMKLCNFDYVMARTIEDQYETIGGRKYVREELVEATKRQTAVCPYPTGSIPLQDRHKAYLEARGFNPSELESTWKLFATDNIGPYKFRIIAPIFINGVMVSYQGRDITGKSGLRYKACKQEDEVIQHQNVVYGLDLAKGDDCIVVEGITDAWRFGSGAVSCFGTSYTTAQTNQIAENFNRCFILFDADDDNALAMSYSMAALLNGRGLTVEVIDISDTTPDKLVDPSKGIDPGNLKQGYADYIKKELGL